jgi:Ca2+-transporting ATPase
MATDTTSPADAHLRDAQELAEAHRVNPSTGLQDDEATQRALQHGANELQDHAQRSALALVADQFKDFMVLVLLGAAAISGAMGEMTDTLVILVIVVLNAAIGFVQAWRADQAMAALRQLAAASATVLRGGEVQVVPASVLVPGDIVLLEAGNQIPADLRLIDIAQLQVDESALTGESVTVAKQTDALAASEASALGDRTNMAFKGTTATHGRARGLVVAIGMHTELGKVARLLDSEDRSTPLQQRLAAFGKRLALAVIGICIVIFAVGVLRGESPLLMALTAISLAVAAIPERCPPWSRCCWRWARAAWWPCTRWCAACRRWRRWARSPPSAPTRPAPSPRTACMPNCCWPRAGTGRPAIRCPAPCMPRRCARPRCAMTPCTSTPTRMHLKTHPEPSKAPRPPSGMATPPKRHWSWRHGPAGWTRRHWTAPRRASRSSPSIRCASA